MNKTQILIEQYLNDILQAHENTTDSEMFPRRVTAQLMGTLDKSHYIPWDTNS